MPDTPTLAHVLLARRLHAGTIGPPDPRSRPAPPLPSDEFLARYRTLPDLLGVGADPLSLLMPLPGRTLPAAAHALGRVSTPTDPELMVLQRYLQMLPSLHDLSHLLPRALAGRLTPRRVKYLHDQHWARRLASRAPDHQP